MSKKSVRYDSQRDRENYTFHPGRQFHLEFNPDPGACYLFALDERQSSLLRTMLSVFPKYHWVWGLPSPKRDWDVATEQQWADISDFVEELEACLLSGCDVSQLITQVTRIADSLEQQQEPTITLDSAFMNSLKALIEAWEAAAPPATQNSLLKGIKDFLEMLTFARALMPVPPIITVGRFIGFLMDSLYRRSELRAKWQTAMNGRIANLLNGGDELVDAGVEFDDYMQIMDMQFGTDDWKTNIPAIGWLFDPTVSDIDVEGVIKLLYDYFKTNDPDQTQASSEVIRQLQTIASAVGGLDITTNINLNNTLGCDCDVEDCECEEGQTITVSENGSGVID